MKYVQKKNVEVSCVVCSKSFMKTRAECNRHPVSFCSMACTKIHLSKKVDVFCKNCNKQFTKKKSCLLKSPNSFCSRSCANGYNNTHNTHKTKGTRVSKLEIWLQQQLVQLYPSIEFHFNRKDAINSELDFYIPSLKLAFELNGAFHYEPIFGSDRLNKIQNNDNRKFQACLERQIELCIIDSSKQKYFKESTSKPYLDIITGVINQKLNC